MGLIICDIHGEQGIVSSVSLDICEEIASREEPTVKEIFVVSTRVYDDSEFLLDLKTHYSKSVYDEHDLSMSYLIRNEEDEEKLERTLPDTGPVCVECFKEYCEKAKITVHS